MCMLGWLGACQSPPGSEKRPKARACAGPDTLLTWRGTQMLPPSKVQSWQAGHGNAPHWLVATSQVWHGPHCIGMSEPSEMSVAREQG